MVPRWTWAGGIFPTKTQTLRRMITVLLVYTLPCSSQITLMDILPHLKLETYEVSGMIILSLYGGGNCDFLNYDLPKAKKSGF